jgi:hypothetical protein
MTYQEKYNKYKKKYLDLIQYGAGLKELVEKNPYPMKLINTKLKKINPSILEKTQSMLFKEIKITLINDFLVTGLPKVSLTMPLILIDNKFILFDLIKNIE